MALDIFIDKDGREIKIYDDFSRVIAKHNGVEVGEIVVDDNQFGVSLWSMEVKENYRRAGIAFRMMKHIAEIYGDDIGKPLFNAVGGSGANAHEYYTEEGASFIHKCVNKGVLKDFESQNED